MFLLKGLDIIQMFISLLPWKRVGTMWPELPSFQEKLDNPDFNENYLDVKYWQPQAYLALLHFADTAFFAN